jgi:hypothetical protein
MYIEGYCVDRLCGTVGPNPNPVFGSGKQIYEPMKLSPSLKARLVEILVGLPPKERRIVINELKEVMRMVGAPGGLDVSSPGNPNRHSDTDGGLIYWN